MKNQYLYTVLLALVSVCGLHAKEGVDMPKLIDDEYKLSVGEKDEERLDLLNRVYNGASVQFLSRCLCQYKGNALELGCGSGTISRLIAKTVTPFKMLAVDRSEEQIELAKSRGNIPPNLELCVADAKKALLEGNHYDIIYTRFMLVHLDDFAAILELMTKALTPNGVIIIEDVASASSQYVDGDPFLSNKLLDIDSA